MIFFIIVGVLVFQEVCACVYSMFHVIVMQYLILDYGWYGTIWSPRVLSFGNSKPTCHQYARYYQIIPCSIYLSCLMVSMRFHGNSVLFDFQKLKVLSCGYYDQQFLCWTKGYWSFTSKHHYRSVISKILLSEIPLNFYDVQFGETEKIFLWMHE